MNQSDRDAIIKLSNNKIDKLEFYRRFSEDLLADDFWLSESLETSLTTQDALDLECVMLVGFAFGFSLECAPILCNLACQEWHYQHENIVSVLGKMKYSSAVSVIFQLVGKVFPYLEYNDGYSLSVKCIYALKTIGTVEAIDAIKRICECGNKDIEERAIRILGKILEESERFK